MPTKNSKQNALINESSHIHPKNLTQIQPYIELGLVSEPVS